jgi:hypothetical protein
VEALWEIDIAFISTSGITNCPGIPYIWASCFDKQSTVLASDIRIFVAATILLILSLAYHEHAYFKVYMGLSYSFVIFGLYELYLLAQDINCLAIKYFCLPSTRLLIVQSLNVQYFVITLSIIPLGLFAVLSIAPKLKGRRLVRRRG